MAAGDEIDHHLIGHERDVRMRPRRARERLLHRPAGRIVHVHDAAMAVPALAREMEHAFLAVEGHAQRGEARDRGGRALDDELHRGEIVEPRARDHRILDM